MGVRVQILRVGGPLALGLKALGTYGLRLKRFAAGLGYQNSTGLAFSEASNPEL